jgi:flagellar M-ring protein FliF
VAKAELTTTSKSTGGGGGRGPVGAVSNVSRAGGTTAAGGGSSSNQETTQTDYLVSEKQSEIESKLGAVTRLSVAALVDLTPQAEGQTTISEANAQELIKKAVGFRPGRDEVTLTNVRLAGPVGPPEPDEALVRLQRVQVYVGLARNISLALAVVLVVLIGALLLLRGRRPAPTPAAAGEDERRRADLARLLDLARAEPDRVAAIFRALLGAPAG